MTLTVEANMDAEQEGDPAEGMTIDAAGPFHSNEDATEICGGQEATTIALGVDPMLHVQGRTLQWMQPVPVNRQNNTRITR
jgi:hypothetical protein